MKIRFIPFVVLAAISICLAQVRQKPALPPALQGIGIDQKLNAAVPLNTVFRDEQGTEVTLGSYFKQKPVLLIPVYYTCPMLCSQILHGVVAGLRPLSLHPGRDFDVVAFSFNPVETSKDAASARDLYSHSYSSSAGTGGWHFLTGSEQSIHALTEAIGFRYRYDPATKMFIHASGVMVLTPEGKIARYFYGVEYEPKDLKLGLVEASNGKIGSPIDAVLLFCYHYDPSTGKYGAVVMNLLRLAGAATVLLLAITLFILWRFDLRRHAKSMLTAAR